MPFLYYMETEGDLDHQIQLSSITGSHTVWWHWHQENCSLNIPVAFIGNIGSSAWHRREKDPGAEGLLGQDDCWLRCTPVLQPTPGSEGVWGRALEHGDFSQLLQEKGLNCWITPTAAIYVQGGCEERACCCHQICNPLLNFALTNL